MNAWRDKFTVWLMDNAIGILITSLTFIGIALVVNYGVVSKQSGDEIKGIIYVLDFADVLLFTVGVIFGLLSLIPAITKIFLAIKDKII